MFTNISETFLWDNLSPALKLQDESTTQMLYNGEMRGQTQRYLIAIGRLVKDLFDNIEKSYHSRDPFQLEGEFLKYIQDELFCEFTDSVNFEDLSRNLLESIIPAWMLKGSVVFLKWIVRKIFGWKINSVTGFKNLVLTNVLNSLLYDGITTDVEDLSVLYSEIYGTATYQTVILTIDVDIETDYNVYIDKKQTLENLLGYWVLDYNLVFVNAPSP